MLFRSERIGSALKLAHDRGVVHRDVKPANILFRPDGTPLLADFGIAKDHHSDSGLTMDGSVVGSPYYLSPELARAQEIDGRADIYSLGIILYEMLVGVKPFKGESAVDTIFKHLNEPPPELPEELIRLQYFLDKMLAKIPSGRFKDMGELLDELRVLRERGFDDLADRVVRSTDTTLMLEKTWTSNAVRRKPSRARKVLRNLGLAAGLAAMALGAWYFTHGGSPLSAWRNAAKTRPSARVTSLAPEAIPGKSPMPNEPATRADGSTNAPAVAPAATASGSTAAAGAAKSSSPTADNRKVKLNTKPSVPPKPKKQTVAKSKPASRPAKPEKTVKQREIEFLSARARLRLRQGKLDSPFGDNAVFYRDELVRVAPDSVIAARISYDIAERYRKRAESEIAAGKFLAARESIDEGLRIQPEHKRLKRLKEHAIAEYSKGWARGVFNQFKQSFSETEAGPVPSSSPGPDK